MDHYTRENYQVPNSIGYLINKSRNLLVAEMDAALKPLGISSQQMGILLMMRRSQDLTPFELSKHLGIDTGLMTRMLDKLEAQAMLTRSRSTTDRRVVHLQLTPHGQATAEKIPEIGTRVLNLRLQHFSPEEFTELIRLLHKFLAA